jgi:uncharacterized protein YndB with AHSA1/START domain
MRFERAVEIAAPPERVWAVLTDIKRWPEWTTSVTSAQHVGGTALALGSRARVVQPKLPPADFVVTAFEPRRRFAWKTGNAVVRAVADHVVEPRGTGSHAVLSVDFGGLLGWLAGWLTRKLTREYLALESEGLRLRAEEGLG